MLPELTEKFLEETSPFPLQKLFYVWGHCYEFDQNDNWEYIKHFLETVSGHEDVWYATNGEIEGYVSAYRRLVFSVDGRFVYNPSCTEIWVGAIGADSVARIAPGSVTELPDPVVL